LLFQQPKQQIITITAKVNHIPVEILKTLVNKMNRMK